MEHQYHNAEDFLLDDSFLRYRMGVDKEAVQYWEGWLAAHPEKQPAFEEACRIFEVLNGRQGRLDIEVSRFRGLLQEHVEQQTAAAAKITRIRWWRVAAAAVLLLSASVAGWKLLYKAEEPGQDAVVAAAGNDVLPGRSRAQLVMGDGKAVELDEMSEQALHEKDGTRIGKKKGHVVYDAADGTDGEIIYNTLTTPRGGEYKVTLPDGSQVWMNAGSSLRFPTRFTGKERTVYLTGEAYFEVAQNAAQPFQVRMANGLKVAVLGTGFNIMAYEDENAVNTTLVTGKVKVISPDGKDVVLSPSQQAILSRENGQLKVEEANVDKVIAWKGGMFEFDDDDISAVMRQLSRWYDVEVKFSGPVPNKHYTGSIRKLSTLSQALRILKTAGIRFSIEGRQIIVEAQQ
ncbi:FecR family protein [Chitinophaga lutea]|uniref:FecR family protein n=1 Tax=Chitinophaga lutea TaxID=2488634 RepID=A0A3N4Q9W7_9BACT|nr:FecR family protein [Chitinophaga lutea]RPE12817.1 FecR family protein [Chitinophaga lutea]